MHERGIAEAYSHFCGRRCDLASHGCRTRAVEQGDPDASWLRFRHVKPDKGREDDGAHLSSPHRVA